MPRNILPVPYHQQDDPVYCGAACVQMVLNEMGTPLFPQTELFARNNSYPTIDTLQWESSPDGITNTLNVYNPSPETRIFVLYPLTDPDILSKKIVWTIFHYRIAPIVLIYDRQHWIVVTGYDISADPTGPDDTSFTISSLLIHNPRPETPIADDPPPPHFAGDRCGMGDARHNYNPRVYGSPNDEISYTEWIDSYLLQASDGVWSGHYLAVCDPDPLPKLGGKRVLPRRYFDGNKIIEHEAARDCALKEFFESGMVNDSRMKDFSGKLSAGKPNLVQRLDKDDDFYYLVPLVDQNNQTHCLISIDGRYGYMKEARFVSGFEGIYVDPLSPEEILNILGRRLYIESKKRSIPIHRKALCIYPTLVWRPCLESLSPYDPFHMVIVGQYRFYISLVKKVFTVLNVNMNGI